MTDEQRGFTEDEWRTQILAGAARCHDCLRPYGDEHGFPDLVIPNAVWERISPKGNEGGLLCPSCICKRLHAAGIRCEGAFMSGPIVSVSEQIMWLIGRVNNLEHEIAQLPRYDTGEGPTECADDDDDLSIALRRLGPDGVNRVLRETLGTPNPLYVDEFGNG